MWFGGFPLMEAKLMSACLQGDNIPWQVCTWQSLPSELDAEHFAQKSVHIIIKVRETGTQWHWGWNKNSIKIKGSGLPWWRNGWESACQCRGHGFEPWSGKIPHAAEQLGPWATTAEPARLEPVLRNKRGRDSERPAHRNEEWPPLAATRESPRTETKTQHSQK